MLKIDVEDSSWHYYSPESIKEDCGSIKKKLFTLLELCVSSLRRGHANLLCIVPILTDDLRRGSKIILLPAKKNVNLIKVAERIH